MNNSGFRPNHLIIFMLVIAHQLISFIWYSPYLFAFDWMNLTGYRLSDIPPFGSMRFFTPFMLSISASILLCYWLATLIYKLNITSVYRGVKLALSCWLVFLFVFVLTHHYFANTSIALTLIDTGRDAIIFAVTGAVLTLWPGKQVQHE